MFRIVLRQVVILELLSNLTSNLDTGEMSVLNPEEFLRVAIASSAVLEYAPEPTSGEELRVIRNMQVSFQFNTDALEKPNNTCGNVGLRVFRVTRLSNCPGLDRRGIFGGRGEGGGGEEDSFPS